MHKCQHSQRITHFCATDCCAWKEAGGCQACIKKYHNHMGATVFLNEQQVNAIVKKYTMDSNIKPKCRVLQEAIYSYFTLIKTQITSSIEAACKNIINQIGYPYLYTNNALSTYKRLKNKEYKKLGQKDFKYLHELTQKISDKELANEQMKIYLNEMKVTEQLINSLQDIIKNYQNLIRKYNPAFVHDVQHIVKINQIFKNLNQSQSPKSKSPIKQEKKANLYQFQQKMQSKAKPLKREEIKSIQLQRNPALATTKPNYSRDASIDKKIIKEPRFGGITPKIQKQGGQQESAQKKSSLLPTQKSQRIENIKEQLKSRQLEINEKKKILIQMMKQKQESSVNPKQKQVQNLAYLNTMKKTSLETRSNEIDQFLNTQSSEGKRIPTQPVVKETAFQRQEKNYLKSPQRTIKNNEGKLFNQVKGGVNITNVQEIKNNNVQHKSSDNKSQKGSNQGIEDESERPSNQVKNSAFTRLPVQQVKPHDINIEKVGKKLVVIPNMGFKQSYIDDADAPSPILKKKSLIDKYRQSIRMTVSIVNDRQTRQQVKDIRPSNYPERLLDLIPIYHKKTETELELRQNQESSLALLLKSLTLKAEQAIIYLQKAIKIAQNNLSAAEYLSFLYLQSDRPLDCLKLCNKMLEKIENSSEPDDLSLIINNNKAAALNILGRYSQSIVLLQKCLRYRQKDYFYKNLGDAYFSVSIYEKATYNYEKALKLNDQHDQAHYNLAVCQYGQQNYHNAKFSIEKAIEINSVNEQYHELLNNINAHIKNC